MVEEIESTAWGNIGVAAARAALEFTVTQQNEQLIRTFHPSLAIAPTVYVLEEKKGEGRFYDGFRFSRTEHPRWRRFTKKANMIGYAGE